MLIAACAVLAANLVSCAGKTTELPVEAGSTQSSQDTGLRIPETGSLVLVLNSDGHLKPFPELEALPGLEAPPALPGSQTAGMVPEPAPFAIQTAVAAVQAPVDGGAVVAINRIGLVFLEMRNRQVLVRRIPGADAEFSGRSVAQAWSWDGKAMLLLHRNEIFETEAARNPVARILAVTSTEALALPAFGIEAGTMVHEDAEVFGSPYAVFVRSSDRWLVQFRLADQEKTWTAFAAWNPGLGMAEQRKPLEPLDRSSYETEARPVSISDAPQTLQRAASALGESLLLDAVMPDGAHRSWLHGSIETALTGRALVASTSVAILVSDGRIVLVQTDGIYTDTIKPPVPKAYFRDLAILDDFVIAVWEEDLFPDLGRSGLVIMDQALLKAGPRKQSGK
jgi:hypothetical protein